MSLLLLVIIVVIGITAVVASVHMTGGTVTAKIADSGTALERFHQDFEGEKVADTVMTDDHETAFLWLENGAMGLVHSIGDRYLTRILTARDIRSVEPVGDTSVSLILKDVTWRGGTFKFSGKSTAERVYAALDGLKNGSAKSARARGGA